MRLPTFLLALGSRGAVGSELSRWVQSYPLQSTILAASARGVVGDIAAQQVEAPDKEVDCRRLFLYVSFTNLIAQVYDRPLYTWLFPLLFPTYTASGSRIWGNVLKAALMDNFVTSPFLYFPLFYAFKDCCIEHPRRGLVSAMRHYFEELPSQMGPCLAFWMPVTCTTQAFVPVHLRVSFLSVAACAWIGLLSTTTSRLDRKADA